MVGVQIAHTFEGLPACGRLCGGDVILRVCGQPVNTAEDVVYHWHHAPPGTDVQFDLQRCETHVFSMSRLNADKPQHCVWFDDKFLLPVVASTEEFSRNGCVCIKCRVPLAGDLILSIGGTPVATSSAASAVLAQQQQQEQEAPPSDEVIEVAVQRGWPEPREGEVASDCCCCSNGTRTKVPKPKSFHAIGRRPAPAAVPRSPRWHRCCCCSYRRQARAWRADEPVSLFWSLWSIPCACASMYVHCARTFLHVVRCVSRPQTHVRGRQTRWRVSPNE